MYGLQRYLGIEKDFLDAQFYVELNQDNVYSEFFTREVILLGAEIEASFKELCYRLNKSVSGNMNEYKHIILSKLPKIDQISVIEKNSRLSICPFADWDSCKLHWWDVYTNVKHNVVDAKASLAVAKTMLKAYLLLLFCISAINDDIYIDIYNSPKLFELDFQISGAAVLPNMAIVNCYKRDEILQLLGYSEEQ